ncbi:MAG: hypothetical protein HYT13_00495 [Candidatus Liptonbacteria bacterium]|nr:hypothetical protein [Candidatus Liptonbacteria bacterium]
MGKKINLGYVIGGVVLVALIIILAASRGPRVTPGVSQTPGTPALETPPKTGVSPEPTPGASKTPTPSPTPPVASPSSIKVISPSEGAEWVVNENHVIAWSKEAGLSGGIYIVDASTKAVIGWVLSNTAPSQTSYTWDTRDLFLNRGSGLKKGISAGKYILKIKFDGPKPETQSGTFSLIYPEQVKTATYPVAIKNFLFSPAALTVRSGDQVVFTNNDPITHKFILSNFGLTYTLASGETLTFDTAKFPKSPSYDFYSEPYPAMRLTVTIK